MTKFRILAIFDTQGWCYHKRCLALQKYAPPEFDIDIAPSFKNQIAQNNYDLIFFLPFSYVDRLRSYCDSINKKPIIVTSFNVGWGYSNNWLAPCIKGSDAVIINSYAMWANSGKQPNTYYIPNGVDRTIFYPTTPIEQRPQKILWCGSIFHQKIKGYEDVLIPLQKKLAAKNITLDLKLSDSTGKDKLTSEQMTQWYNSGSIYICTSLTEGTPNPALEAASCGCTVVSTRVGNMPELIVNGTNGYLVDNRDINTFYNYILLALSKKDLLCNNMQKTISSWDWKTRSNEFFSLFKNLIETKKI